MYEEKNKEELESCAVSENPFTIEDNTSGTHEIAEFEAMVDDNINEEVELCVAIEEPLFVDDDTSVNSHAARFGAVENSCLLSDDSSNEEVDVKIKSCNTYFISLLIVQNKNTNLF